MLLIRWWNGRTTRPLGVDLAAVGLLLTAFFTTALVFGLGPPSGSIDDVLLLGAGGLVIVQIVAFVLTADQRRFAFALGVSIATTAFGALLAFSGEPEPSSGAKLVLAGLFVSALMWVNRHAFR
jgi:hypothetical protein